MVGRARRPSIPSSPDSSSTRAPTIPSWDQDPIWSLRPWPVVVTIGQHNVEIPAMPAADWLAILADDEFAPLDLLDLIPDAEQLLLDSDLDFQEIDDLLLNIITTVSARSWWISLRMIWVVKKHWDVLGADLIYRGVDPERLSLAAWLTAVTFTTIRNMSSEQASLFTARLSMPPNKEEAEKEAATEEMDANAFLAMG